MLKTANRFKNLAATGKWPTTIEVKGVSVSQPIDVKRYIKVITPNGNILPMTPETLKKYVALGLSIRRTE